MRDRAVDARFFVHIEQTTQALSDEAAYANTKVRELVTQMWPFGEPRPHVYCDARACKPRPWFNMHAKCVVVDGTVSLVTSANFTRRAHEQNIECGVLLEDEGFSMHLARQWLGLIDAGFAVRAAY